MKTDLCLVARLISYHLALTAAFFSTLDAIHLLSMPNLILPMIRCLPDNHSRPLP